MTTEKMVEFALESGATMVYVWGASAKVDSMDLEKYTSLVIEHLKGEEK